MDSVRNVLLQHYTVYSNKAYAYEFLCGHKPGISSSFRQSPQPLYNQNNYVHELKYKMQIANKYTRENILYSKEKSKEIYDKQTNLVKLKAGNSVKIVRNNRLLLFYDRIKTKK